MTGHATLHGTITDTGGENCDERGFDWDYDSGEPYANSWTETDSYPAESFSHQITGLTERATVYFRAKAHNSAGWGYGDEKSFYIPKRWIEILNETVGVKESFSLLDMMPLSKSVGVKESRSLLEMMPLSEAVGVKETRSLLFTRVLPLSESVGAKEARFLLHTRELPLSKAAAIKESVVPSIATFPTEMAIEKDGVPLDLFSYEVLRGLNQPAIIGFNSPPGGPELTAGDNVTVKRSTATKTNGIVTSIQKTGLGTEVEAEDYMRQLSGPRIIQTYTNKTMTQIVKHVVDTERAAGNIDITTNNVGTSSTVYPAIEYTGKSIYDILCDWRATEGWDFWVDADKDLHFVDLSTPADSGIDIVEGINLVQVRRGPDIKEFLSKVRVYGRIGHEPTNRDDWTEDIQQYIAGTRPDRDDSTVKISEEEDCVYIAQQFKTSKTASLKEVYVSFSEIDQGLGTDVSFYVTIHADYADKPGATLGEKSYDGYTAADAPGWLKFGGFDIALTNGTKYWVGVRISGVADKNWAAWIRCHTGRGDFYLKKLVEEAP